MFLSIFAEAICKEHPNTHSEYKDAFCCPFIESQNGLGWRDL